LRQRHGGCCLRAPVHNLPRLARVDGSCAEERKRPDGSKQEVPAFRTPFHEVLTTSAYDLPPPPFPSGAQVQPSAANTVSPARTSNILPRDAAQVRVDPEAGHNPASRPGPRDKAGCRSKLIEERPRAQPCGGRRRVWAKERRVLERGAGTGTMHAEAFLQPNSSSRTLVEAQIEVGLE